MTLAEQFECEIPTPDALKEGVLYCSTNATNWTDIWTTVATVITALATVGLVVGAFFAWQTAKKTLDQMKADSAAQSRPYVHAQIVPSIGGAGAWDLIIRNTGNSAARNLRATASVWPKIDCKVTADLRTVFERGRILPPASTIRQYWYVGKRKPGQNTGFDIGTELTLTYADSEGKQTFTDTFHLDINEFKMTPMGGGGVEPTAGLDTSQKKLSEIVTALNNMRREIAD